MGCALQQLAELESSGEDFTFEEVFSFLPVAEGTALFVVSNGCVNHSCVPSARLVYQHGDSTASLLTTRSMAPGDEVTISYVEELAPLEERTAHLAEYGFICTCPRCQAQRAGLDFDSGDEEDD